MTDDELDALKSRVARLSVEANLRIKPGSLGYCAHYLAEALGPDAIRASAQEVVNTLRRARAEKPTQFFGPDEAELTRVPPEQKLEEANRRAAEQVQRPAPKAPPRVMTLDDKQRAALEKMSPAQKLSLANDEKVRL